MLVEPAFDGFPDARIAKQVVLSQTGVGFDARFLQGPRVALKAQARLRVGGVAKEGDAAAAFFDQVAGGEVAAPQVVTPHHRVRGAFQVRAPHGHGNALLRQFIEVVVQGELADHDQPVDLARLHHRAHLVLAAFLQARQQKVHAEVVHRIGQRTQDAEHEWVRDHLRAVAQQHHADGLLIAFAQVGRAHVDAVVERARQFGDAVARGLGDERAAAERARDGGGGHARHARDVDHLYAPAPLVWRHERRGAGIGLGRCRGERWRGA